MRTHETYTGPRHSPMVIAIHWITLLAIVLTYGAIELRELFPKGSDLRADLKNTHFILGLCVLAITAARLSIRAVAKELGASIRSTNRLAFSMHALLYVFLLVMPLLGWLLLSSEGKTAELGPLHLPPLIEKNPALAESLEEVHEAGATLGYILVFLHAAAALIHHYILKDGTLAKMIPGLAPVGSKDTRHRT